MDAVGKGVEILRMNRRMVCACFLSLGAAVLFFLKTMHYGLLGFDSYPLVVTSRVTSWADFVGVFTEPLMDGRYPGDFYRPLVSLSFAWDDALWGLNPMGYQFTNLLLFAGAAFALFLLMGRLTKGSSLIAPWVTLLFFVLHPMLWETLPVPARRGDILCCLGMSMALFTSLSPAPKKGKRALVSACWMLVAIASKESALFFPFLGFLVAWLYASAPSLYARLRYAFRAALPLGAALLVVLTARQMVLGGIGGHASLSVEKVLGAFPTTVTTMLTWLLFPQLFLRNRFWLICLLLGIVLGLFLVLGSLWSGRKGAFLTPLLQHPMTKAALVAVYWLLMLASAYCLSGRIEAWYVFIPSAGFSLLMGAVAGGLVEALKKTRRVGRVAAVLTLLLLGVFALGQD